MGISSSRSRILYFEAWTDKRSSSNQWKESNTIWFCCIRDWIARLRICMHGAPIYLAWSEIKSQLPFGVFDGVNLLICTIMYSFNLLIWFLHLGRKTYSRFLKKFVNFHSVTVAVLLRCSPLLDHSFCCAILASSPKTRIIILMVWWCEKEQ